MNCKKGDMAIVIKSECGNEGRVVTCMELREGKSIVEFGGIKFRLADGLWWQVDTKLDMAIYARDMQTYRIAHNFLPFARDECLMPIGNTDATINEERKEVEPC